MDKTKSFIRITEVCLLLLLDPSFHFPLLLLFLTQRIDKTHQQESTADNLFAEQFPSLSEEILIKCLFLLSFSSFSSFLDLVFVASIKRQLTNPLIDNKQRLKWPTR